MPCAEWYTSVDNRRLSTAELKSKAFLRPSTSGLLAERSQHGPMTLYMVRSLLPSYGRIV
eukprot:4623215-Pyramimonas_sp.AAC.1